MICGLCYDEAQRTDAKLAEEESLMQTLSGRRSNGLSPQSRRIATFAIVLFALSGLISGFAVGAFVRPKVGGTGNNNGTGITRIVQQTKTATPVATPSPQTFSIQGLGGVGYIEVPDGTTTYTLTARLDPVKGTDGQPVRANNLTCKLWLISRIANDQKVYISSDIAKNVNGISGTFTTLAIAKNGDPNTPLPGVAYPEIQQALNFSSSTSQTQACSTDGNVTWRYQVSPSVPPGKYTLVVFYDWSGKHWNWYWVNIQIKAANSD
jgi:hypothetical protein